MSISKPENRTEFLQAFCDQADLNYSRGNSSVAGKKQLERILDMALDLYSSRRPAINSGVLIVTSGERDIPLFSDWIVGNFANERLLMAIERGQDPNSLEADYSSLNFDSPRNSKNSIGFNGFDPINQNLSRPIKAPSPKQPRPNIVKKWVNGELIPVWIQRYASLPSQELAIEYKARHRVEDGDDDLDSKNTVPIDDEGIIFALMSVLSAKGKSFRGEIKPTDSLRMLSESQAQINSILSSITSTSISKR